MKNVSPSESELLALTDKEAAGLLNSAPRPGEPGFNSLNRYYATLMDIFQDADLNLQNRQLLHWKKHKIILCSYWRNGIP